MDDLLSLILEKLEYDFCEDADDVQGNWKIDTTYYEWGWEVTVEYVPYDVSPFPAQTMTYSVTRTA
jgi:hypothetical protein